MIEAVSCGGIVIFRGKILLLYKNYRGRYEGWVLPKGTVESGKTSGRKARRGEENGIGKESSRNTENDGEAVTNQIRERR